MLAEAGIPFEPAEATLDDGGLRSGAVGPDQWVAALAYLKARSVADAIEDDSSAVVLGADTLCVWEGRLLGQPADAGEAIDMLRGFMDGEHGVTTGVAFVGRDGRRCFFTDTARVRWGRVTHDELSGYIDSGDWRGKAGGYNLAERVEAGWPIEVDGDPTTVMGLPMRRLPALLHAWSVPAGAVA